MKHLKFLFSGAFMGILLIVFAIAIGYATFIENDYDAITAKIFVYNARWFEVLLFLMVVNFVGMIFTKQLYRINKLNILIIHLALVIIIVGAAITRYIGFEGQMHIREGKTTNLFRSSDTYISVQLTKGGETQYFMDKVMLTPAGDQLFQNNYQIGGKQIDLTINRYYPNGAGAEELVPDDAGDPYLDIIVGSSDGRHELILKEGETKDVHGIGYSFGDSTNEKNVRIIRQGDQLQMKLPYPYKMKTISEEGDTTEVEGFSPTAIMNVHTFGSTSFVIRNFIESGIMKFNPGGTGSNEGKRVAQIILGGKYIFLEMFKQKKVKIGDVNVAMYLGYKSLQLPFSLKLNEFQLERYPGSDSPSSFASKVTIIDEKNNVEKPYRIFMNNILNYGGYRFFQSSYDLDEKGTILSVNHDYWGTMVTYTGYFLLFGSLIASFFTRKTRFKRILHQIDEIHEKRKKLVIPTIILFISFFSFQSVNAQVTGIEIEKEHAASFGKILVQSKGGRIEPVNTVASKILMKISKKSSYKGLTADQVYLGFLSDPAKWRTEPIIKVADPSIRGMLNIQGDFARFEDFLDENGSYKLKSVVDDAYIKKPALRSTYDKELIYVDERANVFIMALRGSLLNIFPIENDPTNKWVTPSEIHQIKGHNSTEGDMFENYLRLLNEAQVSNNYTQANNALTVISNYQKEKGKAVMPSETKTSVEIFYNKINVFKKLFPVYMMIGVLLVGLFFIQVLNPKLKFKVVTNILSGILGLAFVAQTIGLILRWYIAGHAPWSNGYESMIYIAWTTMLAGFIFRDKSPAVLAISSILSGITLLTAHMSWMNPEITNLVPVLKSYWLTIHVATITASYGFLALGSMMGFLNLCIIILMNNKNYTRVNLTLKELTLIVELALIIGLVLLIIGNFLGGIWANESWGRYWGWDPKETWTLVTVIIYSFILHMTLIPSFRNSFTFNFMAMIGFGCILMTYFGVNYLLSGLHSYAQGDTVQVPNFVYYTLVVLAIVSFMAALNEQKLKKTLESA